jgi:hypothetical protein
MAISTKVHAVGLLNYAKEGKGAVTTIKKKMRTISNAGRTEARRRIAAEFVPRTGFLRRQSRKMQTKVSVKSAEISGRVVPIPRLMNIFEHGATLTKGRGVLRARPVVGPAQETMNSVATRELTQVLQEVGK